jgi:hypothetical protein
MHQLLARNKFVFILSIATYIFLIFPNISYSQKFDTAKVAIFSISSTPTGAGVYIDGISLGLTPILYPDSNEGRHFINLKLDQFVPIIDTIVLHKGTSSVKHYRMMLAASLSIDSDPEGANVYVSNAYTGRTPLILHSLPPVRTAVKIIKGTYHTWTDTLDLSPGAIAHVAPTLQSIPARVRIRNSSPDVEVELNHQSVSRGSCLDTLTLPGQLDVFARQASTGRETRLSLFANSKALVDLDVQFNDYSLEPFYASLLYPGMGQIKNGHSSLGWSFAIAFGSAVAGSVYSQYVYKSSNDDYHKAVEDYSRATAANETLAIRNKIQMAYDGAQSAYRTRNILIGAAVVIYLLSTADALFTHYQYDVIRNLSDDGAVAVVPSQGLQGMTTNLQWKIPL